jgi:hypothetical protein
MTQGWIQDKEDLVIHHIQFKWMFIGLFLVHTLLTLAYFRINWRKTIACTRTEHGIRVSVLRLIQNLSAWFIMFFAVLVILSGFLDEPNPFSLHLFFDVFLVVAIAVHTAIGLRFAMMRKRISPRIADIMSLAICITLSSGTILLI